MSYPNQLIDEIVDKKLSGKLKNLYNKVKDVYYYPDYCFIFSDIHEFVGNIMEHYFNGLYSSSDLLSKIAVIRKSKRNKKYYLCNSYINKLKSKSDDIELLESIVLERIEDCRVWSGDNTAILSDFPGSVSLSDKKLAELLLLDFIIAICDYIEYELSGDLSSFSYSYPEKLLDIPVFSGSKFTMTHSSADGTEITQEEVPQNEEESLQELSPFVYKNIMVIDEGDLFYEISSNSDLPFRALGQDAQDTLRYLISQMVVYEDSQITDIHTSLYDIANELVDYKVNNSVIQRAKNILSDLSRYHHTVKNKDGVVILEYNLIDNVKYGEDLEQHVDIKMGAIVTEAVVNQKLISVKYTDFNRLQDNFSKILCYSLKKEQIMLHPGLRKDFHYSYFHRKVRFPSDNKKKNKELLKNALQDFVDNNVIISDFSCYRDTFSLTFVPLTQAELDDLNR